MSFNSSSNSVSGILFFHVFILRLYGILFTLENCMYIWLKYLFSITYRLELQVKLQPWKYIYHIPFSFFGIQLYPSTLKIYHHNMKPYLGNTKSNDNIKIINDISLRYYFITLLQWASSLYNKENHT